MTVAILTGILTAAALLLLVPAIVYVAQILAVIVLIRREPPALVIRGRGDPQVAGATFIQDPDHSTPAGGG